MAVFCIYDSKNKTLGEEAFFCGNYLPDVAVYLWRLKTGHLSLQECYDVLITSYPQILIEEHKRGIQELTIENGKNMHFDSNEVLLNFVNDSGAYRFSEWWFLEGQKMFDKYCEEGDHFG